MAENLRENVGIEMSRASRLWRTRLDERLVPLGLTQAKWLILLHVSKAGGALPQKDLSERIGVEGPTVVRVLDGLERIGLTGRRGQEGDRRAKEVFLTPAGETVLTDIMRIAVELREEVLAGVSEADLAAMRRVLRTMLGNMSAMSAAGSHGPSGPSGPAGQSGSSGDSGPR